MDYGTCGCFVHEELIITDLVLLNYKYCVIFCLEHLTGAGKAIYQIPGEERPYWQGCGMVYCVSFLYPEVNFTKVLDEVF